ncbi:hypothetical protein C7E23_07980 [Elizabethkingia anophelis]|nr:hypothetical protein C7E23_07980 [Elizabethkingia anophelis]
MMLQINYNIFRDLNLNDEWVNKGDVMRLLNVEYKNILLLIFILLISKVKKSIVSTIFHFNNATMLRY